MQAELHDIKIHTEKVEKLTKSTANHIIIQTVITKALIKLV